MRTTNLIKIFIYMYTFGKYKYLYRYYYNVITDYGLRANVRFFYAKLTTNNDTPVSDQIYIARKLKI